MGMTVDDNCGSYATPSGRMVKEIIAPQIGRIGDS
jgi:hypothetical protein